MPDSSTAHPEPAPIGAKGAAALASPAATSPSGGDVLPPAGLVRTDIHALAAGTWPAHPKPLEVTAADIGDLAAAYDPQRYRAPVVLGHPEDDAPAWGWVTQAQARADGLWLTVELLPEMAELIRQQRYAQVSVALWMPWAPGNPTPGCMSLKHLGFLGAQAPAVKGLTPVRLHSDHTGAGVRVLRFGCDNKQEVMSMSDSQGQGALPSEREQALAEREQALARREAELRRAVLRTELEQHVGAGRITAAEVPALVAVMEAVHGAPVVTLAEGQAPIEPLAALRAHLAALPPRVDLRERAAGATEHVPLPRVPAGYRLSEVGLEVYTRARAWQAQHPQSSFVAAVQAVSAA